jgi:hypothetical protein
VVDLCFNLIQAKQLTEKTFFCQLTYNKYNLLSCE